MAGHGWFAFASGGSRHRQSRPDPSSGESGASSGAFLHDGEIAPPQPHGSGADVRARPLVWHLALFAAALVIPTLALIVLLFWHSAEAEQARVEQEVRDVAKAIAVALDRNLIARQSMLAALSTAPSLQAEDYAAFHRQAGELADAEGLDFVLRDPDGQLLIDTHVSWGEPLPRNALDIDRQVVETRRAAVSNLFICATSRQPCFAVVAPSCATARWSRC